MKNISTLFLLAGMWMSLTAQNITQEYIYFETDKSEINAVAQSLLDSLVNTILESDNPDIQLTGHTDDRGDFTYNLTLSQRRVIEIQNYFIKKGIQTERISIDFYGETKPKTSNESEADRQLNRRVEILIRFEKPMETAIEEESKKILVEEESPLIIAAEEEEMAMIDLRPDLSVFKKAPNYFCISNNRDTVIQGAEGTTVFFKSNSFDAKKVNCDCVEIQLTEFYSAKDIVLNNLDTEAGSRLLETQGAINIEAFCNGKKLDMKRGKKLDIYFPNVNPDQGFQLFAGIEEEDGIDWKRNSRTYNSEFFNGMGVSSRGGVKDQWSSCNFNFFLKRWICNWRRNKRSRLMEKQLSAFINDLSIRNSNVDFSNIQANMDQSSLTLFTSANLGYINCDRYINIPRLDLAKIYIKDKSKASMLTSIVFKDTKSIMNGLMDKKGRHWYRNIPKNKAVWIVAIKKIDEKYFLALEERNTSSKKITGLKFEELSKEELFASLDKMTW